MLNIQQQRKLGQILSARPPYGKAKIALDIDGTAAELHGTAIKEINKRKGTNFSLRDITEYDTGKSNLNMPLSEFLEFYKYVWKERWMDIELILDPQKLRRVADLYDLHYLSNRGEDTRKSLHYWLEYHGIDQFVESGKNIITQNPGNNKADNDYEIYIDDMPDLAKSIESKDNKFLFLVRRPYTNGVIESDRIKISQTTNEALDDLIAAAARNRKEITLKLNGFKSGGEQQ